MTSPEVASPEVTGNDVTGSCITGNDVTGTGNERKIISRIFTRISRVFFTELLYIIDTNNGIVNPTCIGSQ